MANAKPVNDAMAALLIAIDIFSGHAPFAVNAMQVPPPVGVDEELVDCDKLARVIERLQQLDILHCPGL